MNKIYDEIALQKFGCTYDSLSAWNQAVVRQSLNILSDRKEVTISNTQTPTEEPNEDMEHEISLIQEAVEEMHRVISSLEDRIDELERFREQEPEWKNP